MMHAADDACIFYLIVDYDYVGANVKQFTYIKVDVITTFIWFMVHSMDCSKYIVSQSAGAISVSEGYKYISKQVFLCNVYHAPKSLVNICITNKVKI